MIEPGTLITVRHGDFERTDYYQPTPVVYPELSPLRRMARRLTPSRWRKPLRPVLPPTPIERCQALTRSALESVETLTRPERRWWQFWRVQR